MIEKITEELSSMDMVRAITLSGSRTSAINDERSDYDIYIYSSSRVPPEERKRILSAISRTCRIDCSPFEEGDEATGMNGMLYDIMYRSMEWTERQVDDVWRKHNARIGYTTCFLYNIKTSRILYDRGDWFRGLQEELEAPYPEGLRASIIRKNMDVIDGDGGATFLIQAELAALRNDIVSQNHRLAAILASYFDILFAYNRVLHPGEKKLQRYAHQLCPALPERFDEELARSIETLGTEEHIPALQELISSLKKILEKES